MSLIFVLMVAVAFLFALFAAPAKAAPVLGLEMTRAEAPVTHSDERLVYELTVKNDVGSDPTPTKKTDKEVNSANPTWRVK